MKGNDKRGAPQLVISRRQFLQGTGVLILAGAAAGLTASCNSALAETNGSAPSSSTSTATTGLQKAENWPMEVTGSFTASPDHAPIGATVVATGTGYQPNATFSLMWQDVTGSWNVSNGEYYGRSFKENWLTLGTIQTDSQGNFSIPFTVPDGFGFSHDLVVLDNGVIRNKMGYFVDMQASLLTTSGPQGSPITIQVKGMGWQDYTNAWHVEYDNQNTGIVTSVTTHGTVEAVIPATGAVGDHVIRVIEGAWSNSYLNHEECPFPDTPTFNMTYRITPGDTVLPPAFNTQPLPAQAGVAPAPSDQPQIWADPVSAIVGTPMNIYGRNMQAGAKVDLYWYDVSGNRVSGGGWEQVSSPFGNATADASGSFTFATTMPDIHGGDHKVEAQVGGQSVATTTITITPSIIGEDPTSGPVGTVTHLHFKGISWTATANNYYVTYDNSYIGYACGFNSNGDVNIYLPVTGTPGWHFIDFYPGIYKGTETASLDQFRLPMLQASDHPGEVIPVLHMAFNVTD